MAYSVKVVWVHNIVISSLQYHEQLSLTLSLDHQLKRESSVCQMSSFEYQAVLNVSFFLFQFSFLFDMFPSLNDHFQGYFPLGVDYYFLFLAFTKYSTIVFWLLSFLMRKSSFLSFSPLCIMYYLSLGEKPRFSL